MRPKDFWNLSPNEMYLSIKGFSKFNGSEKEEPMNNSRLEELMELYPD